MATKPTSNPASLQNQCPNSDDFDAALLKYLDYSKPDRSVEQQLREWSFQWTSDHSDVSSSSTNAESSTSQLSGTLTITRNSDMTVKIASQCTWTDVNLHWECHASASVPKTSRLWKRWQADDYVSRLLQSSSDKKKNNKHNTLLEAHILHSDNELEERVDCQNDTAEAIKRAILPLADSTLDVFEVLIALPFLPEVKLGKRAKLRLLEDAMCNECEEQGDETIVEELELGPPSKKKNKKP